MAWVLFQSLSSHSLYKDKEIIILFFSTFKRVGWGVSFSLFSSSISQSMASSLLFMINIFIFFFFFHCFSVSSSTSSVCRFPLIDGAEVNGMFVFGSSLVDTGNNNFVEGATARSDYLPYGIDYPTGPSGRFSNGKNLIDGLSELLKIPFTIPPFKHPSYTKGYRIIHGVDFASGGSGILNETGSLSGRVMNFNEQIKNFEEEIRPQLEAQLCISWNGTSGGGGSVISSTQSSGLVTFETILSDYLFVLGVGGNDYLLNYFIWPTSKYKFMCLQKFTDTLISSFSTKIKKLYSLGGRKFVLVSIYPIGCIPAVKSLFGVLKSKNDCRGCFPLFNKAARLYNTRLKSLVDELKTKLPGANLVYINTYQTIYDIIKDPVSQGFKDASNACCEVPSILEGGNGISCKKGGSSCEDRKSHLFFDGLHPTEAVNVLLANKAYYSSNQSDAYPFNVQYLANYC